MGGLTKSVILAKLLVVGKNHVLESDGKGVQ